MMQMNSFSPEYTRKQLTAGILRIGLVSAYSILMICAVALIRNYPPSHIIDRLLPFGIPPLLSFSCAAFLSIFVLTLEQTRTESLLFALICAAFAVLNADILLIGIITDPQVALLISRIDHFFLVIVLLGANLHLTYLVCGKKDHWWVVWLAYGIGLAMAPLTQTSLYFQGVYTYYWGFFAQKAILYDIMSLLWLAGTVYGITILWQARRHTMDLHKKDTIKYLILGFFCAAGLSLTNTPAIYGYEIYPLGTFIFISLILLAYGLFKYNMHIAFQQLRTVIFTIGLLVLLSGIGLIPWLILNSSRQPLAMIAGFLLVVLLYHPVQRIWDATLNLVIRRSSDRIQKEYYAVTVRLSGIHHIRTVYRELRDWLFAVLVNSRCAMVFFDADTRTFSGWRAWNPYHDAGFFKTDAAPSDAEAAWRIPSDHPFLKKILRETPVMLTRTTIERWMAASNTMPDVKDWLQEAGVIIPVYSRARLISILVIGSTKSGRSYTGAEKQIFRNLGVILGPIIENARIMERLERLVEKRTRDLKNALADIRRKNEDIVKNHSLIKKQNHIFFTLFDTSSKIHVIKEFEELFAFTISNLKSLFPDFGFGIIFEGERAGVFETGAFAGIMETERKILLKQMKNLAVPDIDQRLKWEMRDRISIGESPGEENMDTFWTILPMQGRDERIIGKMVIKGPRPDSFTQSVFSIFLGQVASAAQNRLLLRRLETMASTDGLTGTANRAFFDRAYEKTLKRVRLFPDVHFSLIMIDVNGLKRINDHYGHAKGDEMILQVAGMLKSISRETDVLSRIGGDEFALLMSSTDSRQALHVVRRIREKEKDLTLACIDKNGNAVRIPVRISIGVAGSDEVPPEKVFAFADDRMYTDKKQYYQRIMMVPDVLDTKPFGGP
jgi:diguanylate cyclase (GGDEF)-like protein